MKRMMVSVAVCALFGQTASAQFQQIPFSGSNSWHLQGNANRIGIGRFPFGSPLNPNLPATLTVDGRTLNQFNQPANQTGDVFFTYSPAGQPTTWRMHRGDAEIGRIFNNGNENHFEFRSAFLGSDIVFRTPSATNAGDERMRINQRLLAGTN